MTTIPESKRRVGVVHRIAEVRFQQAADQGRPASEAPLLCECGEVLTSGRWEKHRGQTADDLRVERNHAAYRARQTA